MDLQAFAYFLQQLVNGLSLGSIYGLIAIGYTMVYGIIGMINFAHGEIYMISCFLALIFLSVLMGVLGISAPIAIAMVIPLVMFFTGVHGWFMERVAYRPLRGAPRLAPLISAIGVSIFLQNYAMLAQGKRVKTLPPLIKGGVTLMRAENFDVQMSWIQIMVFVTTLVLMGGFTWMIQKTALGRAQRACEQDRTMASLLGVNVDRIISLTFVMGASLAAVAGVMVTMTYGSIDFSVGFLAGMKAFTAAVLGGVGSLPGAILGGFLIGFIESFWSAYFSIAYKDVATFAILVLVLTLRPSGLLGRPEVEKV